MDSLSQIQTVNTFTSFVTSQSTVMGVSALKVSRIAKAWFPLDRTGIVKLCDSSWFQHIVEGLTTIENESLPK